MCEKHIDIFEDMLETSEVMKDVARKYVKRRPVIYVTEREALELLLGRVDLSQRGFNNLR